MKHSTQKRILIVEDDSHIAEGLRLNLALQAYAVRIATNGVDGLRQWKDWRPDLIVLDIMLPGIDGLSVLQNIRLADERMPILILSAKSGDDDKIKGLAYGVDDYLAKPFNLEEFLLRVERLLTRVAWQTEPQNRALETTAEVYAFGPNRINFKTLIAQGSSGTIQLTEQEVKLLKLFIAHRGTPLAREKLLEIGWGYTRHTSTRTVDNFIVRFRKYFEKNPKKPVYFKSIRSVGYLFSHPDE